MMLINTERGSLFPTGNGSVIEEDKCLGPFMVMSEGLSNEEFDRGYVQVTVSSRKCLLMARHTLGSQTVSTDAPF